MIFRESFLKFIDSKSLHNDSAYFAIHWPYFWNRTLIGKNVQKKKEGVKEKIKKRR